MRIEEKIYCKLLQVPEGYVTTYGDLAKAINLKNGQRVVGKIMKNNPFPVIVPCHRVVKSDGTIGGYAYGTERKKYMLSKEGLEINNNKISDFKNNLFRFISNDRLYAENTVENQSLYKHKIKKVV